MAERSLTLLEIHLGDGDVRIGPNRLLGGEDDVLRENGRDPDALDGDTSEDRCLGKSIGIALLVVGLLAAIGVVAARLLGGDGLEDAADLDALDE
ncbi:hypothetical protein J2751_002609 [Halorubrum alkaliphilum]|uniref:Uncharacterized protein n=1 Tax=Halorubrum alkaliphilum TaxID=261290 RepID=A0A8T4GH70_9EURY|nr:hypothetical protein [Halorubrum alkaliphilum]MBP1923566.1 hypothetical protein [Halorubrum alkaliphilum]